MPPRIAFRRSRNRGKWVVAALVLLFGAWVWHQSHGGNKDATRVANWEDTENAGDVKVFDVDESEVANDVEQEDEEWRSEEERRKQDERRKEEEDRRKKEEEEKRRKEEEDRKKKEEEEKRKKEEEEKKKKEDEEKKRGTTATPSDDPYLQRLRANESLPLVYFDITIKKKPVGRIEMVLFPDVAPRSAENFRQLCTGEKGIVPEGRNGAGKPYHFKGKYFYRIVHGFIDQGGAETESVFGGKFKDDPGGLALKHDRKGILSIANSGYDTNDSHFSIMISPQPHLNGQHTIFGQAVAGLDIVDLINELSRDKPDKTARQEEEVMIAEAGQLRKGTIIPDLTAGPEGGQLFKERREAEKREREKKEAEKKAAEEKSQQ